MQPHLGLWARIVLAFRCFFAILFTRAFAIRIHRAITAGDSAEPQPVPQTPPSEPLLPAEPTGPDPRQTGAIQMLALLQREGRFVDFIQEEITAFSDAQVGAAIRAVHQGCRIALQQNISLQKVIEQPENSRVSVDVGFDPSAIKLVGNVTGTPPFSGVLKHHGWRVAHIALPEVSAALDASIVTPAEVEV